MAVVVEACIDSVASGRAAARGGASRLEACAGLSDAGTTPSTGLIATLLEHVAIPTFALVRARGGGFVYSVDELDVMRHDVAAARRLGAHGIVIGALTRDARIDKEQTRALLEAAQGLPVTFHRAFDFTRDLPEALDDLMDLGITRVLTSGGAQTALAGVHQIAALVQRAGNDIQILAGGGIRAGHVRELVQRTGVSEVHVRGARLTRTEGTSRHSNVRLRKALPDAEEAWEETDEALIRAIVSCANSKDLAPIKPPSS